jgi:hypothetical protein
MPSESGGYERKWYASKLSGALEVVELSRHAGLVHICIPSERQCETVQRKFIFDDRESAEAHSLKRLGDAAAEDREGVEKSLKSLNILVEMLFEAIKTDKCGYLTTWTGAMKREVEHLEDRCKTLVAFHHARENKRSI